MLFFIFWLLPEKNCSIAPQKVIVPDSGGLQPPPQLIRLCNSTQDEPYLVMSPIQIVDINNSK